MITSGKIVLQRDGDREFDAYLARPESAGPSIVIFTKMFGMARAAAVAAAVKAVAHAYAARGADPLQE